MRVGVYVYGIASIAAGILDFVWGEFESAHQPIQAWGDHIPGVTIAAYIAAVWLIAGGSAMLWRQSARFGAAALAILYGIFTVFPLPRLYTAPHVFGYRPAVYIGVFVGIGQQLILVVAAAVLYASLSIRDSLSPRAALIARRIFGLCTVDFGLAHFIAVPIVAPMVPRWLPLGGPVWTVLTGIAFVLAGLAIVSGVLDALAAWLLGLMLLVFSLLVLTPPIFASPHNHVAWGANAYNLTAVGAAWIVSEWLAMRRQLVPNQQSVKPALA
jgi:uncharacterized membrane protein YphA (DoxX/SURF4 family)